MTTENWRSIEELLAESKKTHYTEVEWKGRNVKVAWRELEEGDDIPEISESEAGDFPSMTMAQKNVFLRKVAEAELVARVKKAGKVEGCLNDNDMTLEIWNTLPLRLRVQLVSKVFEYDKELRESFLSQPKMT